MIQAFCAVDGCAVYVVLSMVVQSTGLIALPVCVTACHNTTVWCITVSGCVAVGLRTIGASALKGKVWMLISPSPVLGWLVLACAVRQLKKLWIIHLEFSLQPKF